MLRTIYDMYESAYPGPIPGETDPALPIDIYAVAKQLRCKPELLFGYLYYYLDHKHRYQTGERTFVHLFAKQVGKHRHAVNFPYLAAILAAQDQEHSKFAWSLGISLIALAISIGGFISQVGGAA